MDELCRYARAPVRVHLPLSAAAADFAWRRSWSRCWRAVGCSVSDAIRREIPGRCALGAGAGSAGVWLAFALLVSLIAADNLLWRVASWIASYAFVRVTGDLRRDLFRHLTGHAPSYFADRLPGMLTSRITATSNAVFTIENMFIWNVLPPCVATLAAIAFSRRSACPMAAALGVDRRHRCRRDVPPRRRRAAAASRFRRQGRRGRRRDGRRDRQHAAGARLWRHPARASPLRPNRRPRDDGAAAQPALSREAAPAARRSSPSC